MKIIILLQKKMKNIKNNKKKILNQIKVFMVYKTIKTNNKIQTLSQINNNLKRKQLNKNNYQ